MEIGEKIRYARLSKGYSQENMADFLGISTSAYGDIERNKTELTLSRAKKLANILKISILELLGEEIQTPEILQNNPKTDLELLKEETEKLRAETNYWREKFEQQVTIEAFKMIQSQYQREKIGFR
jgi:transcriptional regulator with XRE-family HTH domain